MAALAMTSQKFILNAEAFFHRPHRPLRVKLMKDELDDPILGPTYAWSRALIMSALALITADQAFHAHDEMRRWVEVTVACGAGFISILSLRKYVRFKMTSKSARKS